MLAKCKLEYYRISECAEDLFTSTQLLGVPPGLLGLIPFWQVPSQSSSMPGTQSSSPSTMSLTTPD